MNPNRRKTLLNIINSKKEKAIVPEVVVKVETKVEQPEVKEEVQLGLKDLQVEQPVSEAEAVAETAPPETFKSKKNKKVVDNEEEK